MADRSRAAGLCSRSESPQPRTRRGRGGDVEGTEQSVGANSRDTEVAHHQCEATGREDYVIRHKYS